MTTQAWHLTHLPFNSHPCIYSSDAYHPNMLFNSANLLHVRRILKLCIPFICLLAPALQAQQSPDGIWTDLPAQTSTQAKSSTTRPDHFITKGINRSALNEALTKVPKENRQNKKQRGELITLPMPDGGLQNFEIFETSVMAPELAAKFPEIKTYVGHCLEDPAATVRIDVSPQGFHAQMLSPSGAVYIDPLNQFDQDKVISYYKRDYKKSSDGFECLVTSKDTFTRSARSETTTAARSGSQLRTYRLACAVTGEYTAYHGGTVPLGLAAVVTAINRVTGVYEVELSIRLELVANNNLLIYTNAGTDPYTNDDADALLDENQANVDAVIGDANYDIGHVFSTDGGGLAGLGVVGYSGLKAQGETGLANPIGDPFYIDYVAHEIGHQFGGDHTFNGDSGSCSGSNRNGPTAYEPGSGTTIQAYAGICGNDNIQSSSDAYFHSASFDQIIAHVDTAVPGEGVRTATGNSVPVVDAGNDYTIPAQTPFILTASGMDADGNSSLTYNWEQRDTGPQQDINAGDNGSSPLFRSWTPDADPTRTFPRLSDLLNNTTVIGETLPTTNRTMNFRAIVRDNELGGGGVNTDDMIVYVVNTGAPFLVTSPNTAVDWPANSSQTITWNVAGTTGNNINASDVSIDLSIDGGLTYPISILASTPNDGSQQITLPSNQTNQARIRVMGVNNIFFDISDQDFTISAPQDGFLITPTPQSDGICAPEDAIYIINVAKIGSFTAPVTLSVNGLPAGTSANFSTNPVTPGSSSTLTISGTGSATTGLYPIEIEGNGGSLQTSSFISLEISNGTPSAVNLINPSQGGSESITPSLEWSASAAPASYRLEIDDDPAFGSPEHSILTDQTTANISSPLTQNTPYYWRVTSINHCGETTSDYRYFTTQATGPLPETCSSPNFVIPDGDTNGVTDTLITSETGTILDLDLRLNITHTWIGDLTVVLTHVDTGTSAVLIQWPGYPDDPNGSSDDDIIVILDDEVTLTADTDYPYTTNAHYSPLQPLSVFDGESLTGTWTLKVDDDTTGDTGMLLSWCLQPTVSGVTTTFPLLTVNDVSEFEDAGTISILYSLDSASAASTSFDYSTLDDSALAGSDYIAKSDTESITPSTTSDSFSITPSADSIFEENERFYLILSNPQGIIIPNNLVEITLSDRNADVIDWLSTNGLSLADLELDTDKDGIKTLLEFGFNLDPNSNSIVYYDPQASVGVNGPTGLPFIELSDEGSNSRLQIIYPRRKTEPGMKLDYAGWFSNSLGSWIENTNESIESINSDWEKVTIDDTVTIQTAPEQKRFGRVSIDSD